MEVLHRRRLLTRSPGRVLSSVNTRTLSLGMVYSHAAVKVHAINSNRGVVFNTKIDMFADAEPKVASLREVALTEFVFLDLQSTFQDFLCLGTTDSNMDCDLFVTADTEGSDGVAGFAYGCECQR
jgi:hypothetical protein